MDDDDAVIVRRMKQNMPTDADADTTKRAAQLEANNAALHAALSSKNAHIAMLEERILKMSVELASSRAREDEQKLIYRRRSTQQADIMSPSEDDNDGDILLQDGLVVPKPVRNTNSGRLRRRGSSRGSSVSPCSDDQKAADHLIIDDSIKSAPPAIQIQTTSTSTSSTNNHRRFSLMSGGRGSNNSRTTPQEDLNDSERSLNSAGGGGFGNFIGNLIHTLDRSDKSDDLNVNFPHTGRRRSSLMDDNPNSSTTTVVTNNSHLQEQQHQQQQQQQQQRRVSVVGQLFRLRNKSELTANNDAVEEEEEEEEIICEKQQQETTTSCEHQQHQQQQQEEGQQALSSSQDRRRPNRSKMLKIQASTRLISSTVAFPREDDDYDWGFE